MASIAVKWFLFAIFPEIDNDQSGIRKFNAIGTLDIV
jgi:hypothetical protein